MKSSTGHRKRMVEKFLSYPESFSKRDIIELLLFIALPRIDTKEIANEIDKEFKFLHSFCAAPIDKLRKIQHIGPNACLVIKLIYEMVLRITREQIINKDIIENFHDLVQYCKMLCADKNHEELRIIFLDSKKHVLRDILICKGSVNHININTREILLACLNIEAYRIVMVHNHPSKDPSPSGEDIEITRYLKRLLGYINVIIEDHLIIGGSCFFSFRQNNLLNSD